MHKTKNINFSGFILLPVLFLSLAILSAALLGFSNFIHTKRISKNFILGKRIRGRQLNTLLNMPISTVPIHCNTIQNYKLCTKMEGPKLKLIKFSELEAYNFDCDYITISSYKQTSSGKVISDGSHFSRKFCDEFPLEIKDSFFISGNIHSNKAHTIRTDSGPMPLVISASGWIDFTGSIDIKRDTIIIAGGDILINTFRISNPDARAWLISLSGRVYVENKDTDNNLGMYGKLGINGTTLTEIPLPENLTFLVNKLHLSLRQLP